MSRFKPGDLVLIIGDDQCPNNIGKTGVLDFFVLAGEEFIDNLGDKTTTDGDQWVLSGDGLEVITKYNDGYMIEYGQTSLPEKYLMPLRDDDFSHELIESINQGERVAV